MSASQYKKLLIFWFFLPVILHLPDFIFDPVRQTTLLADGSPRSASQYKKTCKKYKKEHLNGDSNTRLLSLKLELKETESCQYANMMSFDKLTSYVMIYFYFPITSVASADGSRRSASRYNKRAICWLFFTSDIAFLFYTFCWTYLTCYCRGTRQDVGPICHTLILRCSFWKIYKNKNTWMRTRTQDLSSSSWLKRYLATKYMKMI